MDRSRCRRLVRFSRCLGFVTEGSSLVRGGVGDKPIYLSSLVIFRQVLGNRHPIFSHKKQTVAVFIDLHLVAGADPAAEPGLGLFVRIEVTGTERLAEVVHVRCKAVHDRFSHRPIRVGERSSRSFPHSPSQISTSCRDSLCLVRSQQSSLWREAMGLLLARP